MTTYDRRRPAVPQIAKRHNLPRRRMGHAVLWTAIMLFILVVGILASIALRATQPVLTEDSGTQHVEISLVPEASTAEE